MTEKFHNKYRIPSARLRNWDYGWNGLYFITICAASREHYFGVIENKNMVLSEIGKIAQTCWQEILFQFPFIQLDTYVVMPNHVHGIIEIQKCNNSNNLLYIENENGNSSNGETIDETELIVEMRLIASLRPPPKSSVPNAQSQKIMGGFARNKNPMINDDLSRIVRWYKGRTTFESRKINPGFGWQSRFHDPIIRNDEEYQRVANYIDNNPANWGRINILNDDLVETHSNVSGDVGNNICGPKHAVHFSIPQPQISFLLPQLTR